MRPVALATGSYTIGPDSASLQVRTYREGMAAKAGHDLVIEVTRWEATVEIAADAASSTIQLSADPRSLHVREGVRGLKPLTDKDRSEIAKNIDDKVLHGQPISFRSSAVRLADGDGRLTVEGELTMRSAAGSRRRRPWSERSARSGSRPTAEVHRRTADLEPTEDKPSENKPTRRR
jgi:polyisoprenoid-binding protein YceI